MQSLYPEKYQGCASMSYRKISIASAFSLLVIWELIPRTGIVPSQLFPPPSRVLVAWGDWATSGEMTRDLLASLWRVVLGFLAGGAIGILLGVACGYYRAVNALVAPIVNLLRPLPPVALIPFFIIWAGISDLSKIESIAYAAFFSVWLNTVLGVSHMDKKYLWSARSLNLPSRLLWTRVIFPAALPFIIAGLRGAISVAFVMVFVSELAGASSGIGYQINASQLAYQVDRMMAALVMLGVLGAGSDYFVSISAGWLFPWLNKGK